MEAQGYTPPSMSFVQIGVGTVVNNNVPCTSIHFYSSNHVVSGDKLMLFDWTTMLPVRVTADTTNFKYVICIDSSTCIAADDSTLAFNYYQMTSSNFLGATDSATVTTIASISSIGTTGLAALPS